MDTGYKVRSLVNNRFPLLNVTDEDQGLSHVVPFFKLPWRDFKGKYKRTSLQKEKKVIYSHYAFILFSQWYEIIPT